MTTPTFTSKHYKAIAASLRAQVQQPTRPNQTIRQANFYVLRIAKQLAHDFQFDNPRFDEAKFLRACGFSGKSVGKPSCTSHSLVKVTS